MAYISPLTCGGYFPHIAPMDEFLEEVRVYCAATGTKPQRLLRAAIGSSWNQWDRWCSGKSSPTLAVVDRLRKWMADHPPAVESEDAA